MSDKIEWKNIWLAAKKLAEGNKPEGRGLAAASAGSGLLRVRGALDLHSHTPWTSSGPDLQPKHST